MDLTNTYFTKNLLNKLDKSLMFVLLLHTFETAFSQSNDLIENIKDNESSNINSTSEFDGFLNEPHNTVTEFIQDVEKRNLVSNISEESGKEYKVVNFEFHRIKTPFLISIWIFCASLAKIGFHMYPRLNQEVPESCLLIVVGVLIGLVLLLMNDIHISPLTPDTFFLYMLPPIILDAGYYMPNRLFFDNLGTILMFAVIGTIFNTLTIGISLWVFNRINLYGCDPPLLEIFLFATLISAVDPVAVLAVFEEIHVNEVLYIVVFGESLLNDAVTVVLYHMFEVYNEMGLSKILYVDLLSGVASFLVVAIGGTVIGIVWGFLTGFVTRFTHQVRVIEPILIFVTAYTAYLHAEMFHMSGILAITFCGITMKNYVEANISHKSHTTIKYAMKMLSSSSETIIFMMLGVSTISENHNWNTVFVLCTIFFCTLYRTIGVVLLTSLVNRFRLIKLNCVDEFVMSYGGLRGAVAFALALLINPNFVHHRSMFVTTTIAVIYFTVFIQGITIRPLVKILNVKTGEKRKPTMNERIHERFMDHLMAGVEDILGHHGNHHLRDKFRRFDNKFIRPYILRDHQGAEPKILETYSKLAMKDALDFMRRNASTIGNISNTESVSAIFRNYTACNLNTSSSCSQLDASTWNIDLQELEYNPCKKDLTDAKIHHLLEEELRQPSRRHRRLSYSRHAVDERDLSNQANFRTQMTMRRLVGDQHKRHHRRSKRLNKDGKPNHVSFPGIHLNGSAKQFSNGTNEIIDDSEFDDQKNNVEDKNSDDWENGITFTVDPTPKTEYCSDSSSPFRFLDNSVFDNESSSTNCKRDEVKLVSSPTVAEVTLPWRRHGGLEMNEVRSPISIGRRFPWKRSVEETDIENGPVKQNEFPPWTVNREYLQYDSPSTTYLGNVTDPKVPSVIGFFNGNNGSSDNQTAKRDEVLVKTEQHLPTTSQTLVFCTPVNERTSRSTSSKNNKSFFLSPYLSRNDRGNYTSLRRRSMMELNATPVSTIPEEDVISTLSKGDNDSNRFRSSSLCIPLSDEKHFSFKRNSSSSLSSSSSDDTSNFG